MSEHETKVKIMEKARVLFAQYGFEGTSIRDIASAAEVNVAAINYHFSNKENLFTAILSAGYRQCSEEMRRYYNEHAPSVEECLLHLFRYFITRSHDLISFFKMMMSDQHSHHLTTQGSEDALIGPPGGAVVAESLRKEVDGNISDEDLYWGIKCLFSHVVHMSLMYNCCFRENSIPFTQVEDIEKSIRRLSKVVIQELKSK